MTFASRLRRPSPVLAAIVAGSLLLAATAWLSTDAATNGLVRGRAAEIARLSRLATARPPSSPEMHAAAAAWMRSAPLGLFIHFGAFSALDIPTPAAGFRIDRSAAALAAAGRFAPNPAAAESWIQLAKRIGASYITIIAKHHDGFAMWPTRMSLWGVSPTEDIVGRAIREARRAGLRVFLYYSLLDWHELTYKRDAAGYLAFVGTQLRELLTWYGPIAGIWFDGSWDHGVTDAGLEQLFAEVHRLQPWALVADNSHRRPLPGADFEIFEGGLPGAKGTIGHAPVVKLPLQSAVPLGRSWSWDGSPDPSSGRQFRQLRAAAKSAHVSLLANVAPDPSGRIPAAVMAALSR